MINSGHCSTRSISNNQPYITHKTTSSHAPPPLPPCTSSSTPLCNTMLLYLLLAQLLRVPVLVLHMVPPTRSHHSPIHTHAITLNLPSYSCKHQTHHHTQPHQLRLSRHTHTHIITQSHTHNRKSSHSVVKHTQSHNHTHTHMCHAQNQHQNTSRFLTGGDGRIGPQSLHSTVRARYLLPPKSTDAQSHQQDPRLSAPASL